MHGATASKPLLALLITAAIDFALGVVSCHKAAALQLEEVCRFRQAAQYRPRHTPSHSHSRGTHLVTVAGSQGSTFDIDVGPLAVAHTALDAAAS